MTYEQQTEMRFIKARNSFFLKNIIPWNRPSRTKYKLYESMVLSVLTYGCAIYSPSVTALKRMESFQKVSFKWIFGNRKLRVFYEEHCSSRCLSFCV